MSKPLSPDVDIAIKVVTAKADEKALKVKVAKDKKEKPLTDKQKINSMWEHLGLDKWALSNPHSFQDATQGGDI